VLKVLAELLQKQNGAILGGHSVCDQKWTASQLRLQHNVRVEISESGEQKQFERTQKFGHDLLCTYCVICVLLSKETSDDIAFEM